MDGTCPALADGRHCSPPGAATMAHPPSTAVRAALTGRRRGVVLLLVLCRTTAQAMPSAAKQRSCRQRQRSPGRWKLCKRAAGPCGGDAARPCWPPEAGLPVATQRSMQPDVRPARTSTLHGGAVCARRSSHAGRRPASGLTRSSSPPRAASPRLRAPPAPPRRGCPWAACGPARGQHCKVSEQPGVLVGRAATEVDLRLARTQAPVRYTSL